MRHAHLDTRCGTASGTFGQLQECSSANLVPQTAQIFSNGPVSAVWSVQAAMNAPPPSNRARYQQKRSRDRARDHQKKLQRTEQTHLQSAGETIPARTHAPTHPPPTTHHTTPTPHHTTPHHATPCCVSHWDHITPSRTFTLSCALCRWQRQ
jgi:hypothetical protein